MSQHDFDFFVIGAGSGGVRAARMAASFGARVAVAEERYYGGTCVNVGCIPKKLFVYGSRFPEDRAVAAGYGWTVDEPQFDWPTLVRNKDTEIQRLNGIYERMLKNAGCEVIPARATLVDPHTVEVDGKHITATHILVATGGWPLVPEIPGREHILTSNEMFHLERLPRRMVVVGGGYIAVEFAGILRGLGCEVTQLYRGEMILRGFDTETAAFLVEQMRHKGIDLRLQSDVVRIDKTATGLKVSLKDGSTLEADGVLYATGRVPMTANLGL